MTTWAVVLAYLGASNPFRRRSALNVRDLRTVAGGAAVAFAGLIGCALLGASLRDALDVSAPNARIAAGLVLIVGGLHAAVSRIDGPERFGPTDADGREWLVPVTFPALLRPDAALLAFAAEGTDVVPVGVAAALALGGVVGWWRVRGGATSPVDAVERAAGAVLGVVLVLAAVRLVLDGVFAL